MYITGIFATGYLKVSVVCFRYWGGMHFVSTYRGVLLGTYILCTYSNCGDTILTHYIQMRDVKDVVVHADHGGDL